MSALSVCTCALNSLWRRHRRTATNDNNRDTKRTNVPNCQHQAVAAALSQLSAPWQPCLLTVRQPQPQPQFPPQSHICALLPFQFALPFLLSPVQHTKRFPFITQRGSGGGGGTQKYLLYSYVFMFLMLLFLFLFALSMLLLLPLSAPLLLMLYTASRAPVRERVFGHSLTLSLSFSLRALALVLFASPRRRPRCPFTLHVTLHFRECAKKSDVMFVGLIALPDVAHHCRLLCRYSCLFLLLQFCDVVVIAHLANNKNNNERQQKMSRNK